MATRLRLVIPTWTQDAEYVERSMRPETVGNGLIGTFYVRSIGRSLVHSNSSEFRVSLCSFVSAQERSHLDGVLHIDLARRCENLGIPDRSRSGMRLALANLPRFFATVLVSKH